MKSNTIIPVECIPLGQSAQALDKKQIYNIFANMITISNANNGIGLSAVQIGFAYKMFIVQSEKSFFDGYKCFVDCEYVGLSSEKTYAIEGCLSLKDPETGFMPKYKVPRYNEISVSGFEFILNKELELIPISDMKVSGFQAVIFQHEIDHQNGILIRDIGQLINII